MYKGKGGNPLAYLGIEKDLAEVYVGITSPTSANKNMDVGDIWINKTLNKTFIMTSKTSTSASWMDLSETEVLYTEVEISSAEILALAASPKELVAAPGAGKYIEFLGGSLSLNFLTAAYDDAAADGDINIRYDGSTVVSLTIDSDGFIDAAADVLTTCKPLATDVVMLANKKLELDNDGTEFTATGGGAGTITARISYRIVTL